MRNILNGEVFFVLFLLSGFYKEVLTGILPIDVTLLFWGLSVICAMGRLYKRRSIYRDMIKPVLIYGIISFLMLFSLLFAVGNPYAFNKTINFIVITGWSFVGSFLLTLPNNPLLSLKRYISTFLIVGIAMIVGSFYSDQQSLKFTSSFGSNYLALGKMTAIVSLVMFTYLMIVKQKKQVKLLVFFLFLISTYTLLVSGGRMPVLSFIVCLLVLLSLGIELSRVKFKDIKIKKKTLIYSFGGLISSPILFIIMKDNNNVFLSRFLLLFNGGGDSALGRTRHYDVAWKAFYESYFLGVGSGGYLTFMNSLSERAYPHNVLLEFMAELGIAGLVFFLILLVIALSRYFRHYFNRDDFYSITILLLFVYSLLNALTSGDINDNRMLFFFIALLSFSKVFANRSNEHPVHTAT